MTLPFDLKPHLYPASVPVGKKTVTVKESETVTKKNGEKTSSDQHFSNLLFNLSVMYNNVFIFICKIRGVSADIKG